MSLNLDYLLKFSFNLKNSLVFSIYGTSQFITKQKGLIIFSYFMLQQALIIKLSSVLKSFQLIKFRSVLIFRFLFVFIAANVLTKHTYLGSTAPYTSAHLVLCSSLALYSCLCTPFVDSLQDLKVKQCVPALVFA